MSDALTRSIPRSVWWGWGDPRDARPLPDHAWHYIEARIGAHRRPELELPVPLDDVLLPQPALSDGAREALEGVVGAQNVRDDRLTRVEHAGGKSFPDLVRIRRGDGSHAPDAVVFPGTSSEVQAVLETCASYGVAVVPFGGGTSVVGGVSALRGRFDSVITLDLRRLDELVDVDTISRTATLQAGMRGPDIEAALRPLGFTLGHYPQSHQEATFGGYVATRSAGQASTGYGRIDDVVLGAKLATPAGPLTVGGHAPASAAGPRLLDLVVGSEGTLGVITEATVRVTRFPDVVQRGAWSFPSMEEATSALREMAQDLGHGLTPDVCRISDAEETRVSLALAGRAGTGIQRYLALRKHSEPVLGIFLWEGHDREAVSRRRTAGEDVLSRHGGVRLPKGVAEAWEHGRFSGPYLRDELLDHHILAETLETAATWWNLVDTYVAVRRALLDAFDAMGTPAIVQCHVSHVYPSGASLYFTCVARGAEDLSQQWLTAKAAASAAIVTASATITHHHAVGTDHAPYLAAEIGELGVALLRSVKQTLDPTGILNPGKLIG